MTPRTRTAVCLLALALATADAGRCAAQQPLPPGARLRLGTLDLRHTDNVTFVGFPAGGRTLVSGGGTGDVVLWDLSTGRPLRRYDQGTPVALSPDGKWLALRADWTHLVVVELASGKERCVCHTDPESIGAAAFSASGDTVFVGTDFGPVLVFHAATGKEVRRFENVAGGHGLWLSADDQTLFALEATSPSTLQVCAAATGKVRHTLAGLDRGAAAVTPDGKTVVVSRDGEVIVWDAAAGKARRRFRADAVQVGPLAITADGRTVALIGTDTLRVFDVTGEKAALRWSAPCPGHALAFAADGKTIAVGCGVAVRLWESRTGKEVLGQGHHAAVGGLRFTPDGKALVSFAADHTLRAWDLAAGTETHRWDRVGYVPPGSGLVVSADGKSMVYGSARERLRFLDLVSGKEKPQQDAPQGLTPAALSPDGKHLITVNAPRWDLTCTLWEMLPARKVRKFIPASMLVKKGQVVAVAFAPDGNTFATLAIRTRSYLKGSEPVARSLSLWDLATGKERRITGFRPVPAPAYSLRERWALAFRDGGKTLISVVWGGPDHGLMQLWDVDSLQERRRFRLPLPLPFDYDLAFAPDGRFVAGTDFADDAAVNVWRTDTGRLVKRFRGHRDEVTALAFSPDGRVLASGSADTTILVWDVIGWR